MNIKILGLRIIALFFACIFGIGCFFSAPALADGHGEYIRHFERENQHNLGSMESDNEGNETAGQIAAWLLVLANFTIFFSILTIWINRFAPLAPGFKKALTDLNRFQKKHLMRFHYFLNPIIAGIALWHWLSSRCKSTSLPEWGLLILIMMISFGIFLKYKIGPKPFRKIVYQIHTQPFIIIAMIMVLTIGHMIVD
ncbi:MAG: hypothetical protein C4518_10740 [Desulfobacteraceae bacterium]|nr:MAG: hypothetical protein C4518_10740 [Desulfobacteraceae bacterium]